jgi:hypothetical protein
MGPWSICCGLGRRVGNALGQQILRRSTSQRGWFRPRGRLARLESLEERALLSADEGWSLVKLDGLTPGQSHDSLVLWRDYDADGQTDLLVAGQSDHGQETILYHNEGGNLVDSGLALPGLT